jgi:hypothetical protein
MPLAAFTHVGARDLKHTYGRTLRGAGVPLETRKALVGDTTGDIATYYSFAEVGEPLAATNRACSVRGTRAITMIQATAALKVTPKSPK